MKYFKDNDDQPWAYEDDVPGEKVHPGLVQITEKEFDDLRNPLPQPITADELKKNVTNYRWKVETGGISLPGGIKVVTGIEDQNRITTVVANARLAGFDTVNFKAATGWVTLKLAEVEAIAAAVSMHVQACFTTERMHHEAIDTIALTEDPAARQAALDGYDESQGWPS